MENKEVVTFINKLNQFHKNININYSYDEITGIYHSYLYDEKKPVKEYK